MLRYNKAVEFLQMRFADALNSIDPRYGVRSVETMMQRDQFQPYMDKFLVGSHKVPALFLLVSDQLWCEDNSNAHGSAPEAAATSASSATPEMVVSPPPQETDTFANDAALQKEEEEALLSKVMFVPKLTNVTGVAAIIYAVRVPNPKSTTDGSEHSAPLGGTQQQQQDASFIDVTSEVLFGVLQNSPVEEFIALARDFLIPIGLHCHQAMMLDFAGVDPSRQKSTHHQDENEVEGHHSEENRTGGDVTLKHSDPTPHDATVTISRPLRSLLGYSTERAREKTAYTVDHCFRLIRASVDNIERLDKEKGHLIGFVLDDPHRVLRRVHPTATGIEKASKDPTVQKFTTSLFVKWINHARLRGCRDAMSGFYPIATPTGRHGRVANLSGQTSRTESPSQPSLTVEMLACHRKSMMSLSSGAIPDRSHTQSPVEPSTSSSVPLPPSVSQDCTSSECYLNGEELVPLNPPRQYDFQLLPEGYGPLSEISHWKAFELHAQHLCDTAESKEIETLEAILQRCNPKLFEIWSETLTALRVNRDEATNVVKFLHTVERFFEPLYGPDPSSVMQSLPDLVKTISLLHRLIPHYRSKEHIQQLVQSVSHQLIVCSKNAIRSVGRVWEQADNLRQLSRILDQFRNATALCRGFQDRLSSCPEVFANVDELAVFGKLELFCSRLNKLTNLFAIVEVFRRMEAHHLEGGMDVILTTFFGIFEDLRRKSGDSLEYTKPSFDKDYLDFINKVGDIDCSLQVYVNSCFEDVPNTVAALELLRKFSILVARPILKADLQAKYFLLFQKFGTELESVQRVYEQHKADPPIARNAPPVAGRIFWARQLHARIESPMRVFQQSQSMVTHQRETGKIVRLYNRVAMALTEYEAYWLETWRKAVEVADDGLKATLLVREPVTNMFGSPLTSSPKSQKLVTRGMFPDSPQAVAAVGERYAVNFDASVSAMVREAQWIRVLGGEIPKAAAELVRHSVGKYATMLQYSLQWFSKTLASIHPMHMPALTPHIHSIRAILRPACESITWNSAYLPPFLDKLSSAIVDFGELVDRVNATAENLIADPIRIVGHTLMTPLPPQVTLVDTQGSGAEGGMEGSPGLTTSPAGSMNLAVTPVAAAGTIAEDELLTIEALLSEIHRASTAAYDTFSTYNQVVRDAVNDLCAMLDTRQQHGQRPPNDDSEDEEGSYLMVLNVKYNRLLFRAVLDSTLNSLAYFRENVVKHTGEDSSVTSAQRPSAAGAAGVGGDAPPAAGDSMSGRSPRNSTAPSFGNILEGGGNERRRLPLLRLDVALVPPHVLVSPSLEEVQLAVNMCIKMILGASQGAGNWANVRGAYSTSSSAPFSEEIHRNKSVVKHILLLTGSLMEARKEVEDFMATFDVFKGLWMQNPYDVVKQFAEEPHRTIGQYQEEMAFCAGVMSQILLIPDTVRLRCFLVDNKSVKASLSQTAQKWMDRYGTALNAMLDKKLSQLFDETDVLMKKVAHETSMDVEAIHSEMEALEAAHVVEMKVERELQEIAEGCHLMEAYRVGNAVDIGGRATDLSIKWKRISAMACEKKDAISGIQLPLRHRLSESVRQFGVEMICFRNDFEENGPLVEGIRPDDAIERLKKFQRGLQDRMRRWQLLFSAEQLFGDTPHRYPELARTVKDLYVAEQLYTLFTTVRQRVDALGKILWRKVKYDEIVSELVQFQHSVRRLPQAVRSYEAYQTMKQLIDRLLDLQPVVEQLSHRAVRERHWHQVMKICGSQWSLDKDAFFLSSVWNANLIPFKDEIVELAMASEKEGELEIKLHQAIREWKEKQLSFAEYKHRGFITLKGDDTMTLKESLDETLVLLGSMMASKYVAPFRQETAGWTARLSAVGEVLNQWLEVQASWTYLEAVFSSGDIVKQLPQDAKRFAMVDRQWVKLFFRAVESPNLLEFSFSNEVKSLAYLKDQLDLCQRALASYLEAKRNAFARFYFVSDSVLLEVLAQGSDPMAMQPHFSTIFDGIHVVQLEPSFDKKGWRVKAIVSAEDEVVTLSEAVVCEGGIEEWLNRLNTEMCRSVRIILREAVGDALSIRTDAALLKRFYLSHFSQVVLTALQVLYTTSVSEVLSGPPAERKDLTKRLSESKDILAEQARGDLTPAQRTHIQTLTTMAVHNLEVWEDTVKKAKDVLAFEWMRQLRFYWTDRNECILRIADADILYCNEYLGVRERLVITPLTDRCYITLSQALAMYMGGAPAGPAGTGKTETVKDLGRAAGKYVVVFNCSDQFDARATSKIFRGLAQSGCWGCLDEFNRITLPVLSVVSQQVHLTFQGLKQHVSEFIFADGQPCRLQNTMGVFVTMNPGYAGRQELPENLKVHFRGVSMMVPDRLSIMKTKLAAAGYKMDKTLSQKFFLLYAVCEQQLSKQNHYDFGLRNILSVLRAAGDILRQSTSNDEEAVFMRCLRDMNTSKFVHEDVPVFLSLLSDIFAGKTPDKMSFPQLETALARAADELQLTATESWAKKCIELYETKLVRHGVMIVGPAGSGKSCCIRALLAALQDMETRHREVRLNPKAVTVAQLFGHVDIGSGDWFDGIFSSLWRRCNKDRNTAVWLVCDGPVDTLWIESLNTVLDDNKLLTLANGDRIAMSPTLKMCFEVESLENASPATVSRAGIIYVSLEDVGWLPMFKSMLAALVSTRRWTPTAREYFQTHGEAVIPALFTYIQRHCDSYGGLTLQHCLTMIVGLAAPLVEACIEKFRPVADQLGPKRGSNLSLRKPQGSLETPKESNFGASQNNAEAPASPTTSHMVSDLKATMRMIFWYSLTWGLGGSLDEADRVKLSAYVLRGGCPGGDMPPRFPTSSPKQPSSTSTAAPPVQSPLSPASPTVAKTTKEKPTAVPEDPASPLSTAQTPATLFDYFVDVTTTQWVSWSGLVPEWRERWDQTLPIINASNLFVPHLSSVVLHSLMKVHYDSNTPILLIGKSGSAKTVMTQEFLRAVATDDVVWSKKNISRATTPTLFQRTIEDLCEKRMGSLYGPQRNRTLNLLIDDLGMAEKNEWGDQPTLEIMRQLIEMHGFYNIDRIGDFKKFVDIRFFGALTTNATESSSSATRLVHEGKGSIQSLVCGRLLRHFAVYYCPIPSTESLQHIFDAIMAARFEGTFLHTVSGSIVSAAVQCFSRCQAKLLPTPTRLHYAYNLRDLSRVFQGMLMCPLKCLDTTQRLIQLWFHEMQRVFGDKLCHAEDVQWFHSLITNVAKDTWSANYFANFASQIGLGSTLNSLFTNFLGNKVVDATSGELVEPPKEYRLGTIETITRKITVRIREFNELRNPRTPAIDVVMFEAAVSHICRVARLISTPRGNALLIGFGGSGKQTTARLAAYLQQQPLFQPSVNTEYTLLNWFEDLRGQYYQAASQGHCVMLISDADIKSEEFLEYINTSLSSGDVPGLFNADEKEIARGLIRPIGRKLNRREFEDSEEWLWNYFIQRVQENLHFVICLSPIGDKFRRRVRQFPAILAACTVDYFFPWSREAMLQVAAVELNRNNFVQTHVIASPKVLSSLGRVLVEVEEMVRLELCIEYFSLYRVRLDITPELFLQFLRTYNKLYVRKENLVREEAGNLRVGLAKLQQAGHDVVEMRKELNIKEVALAKSTAELSVLLEKMNAKAVIATDKKRRVQFATDTIAAEAESVSTQRGDAEKDLVAAQPALRAAKDALKQITPPDIITLRAMRRPPELVRRIFDGVCILLHEPVDAVKMTLSNGGRARIEDSWATSGRQVCSRPALLETLLEFNVTGKDKVNDETCELLLPYLWQDDFTFERAKLASGNIAGLCTWVRAMEAYRKIAKFVAPKIDALHTAEVMLRIADSKLQSQKAELEVAEKEMADCLAEVEEVQAQKDALERDTMKTKQRLAYASKLIEALAEERLRWEEQEREFNSVVERLVGDALAAAAVVSFGGPLNADFRARLVSKVGDLMTANAIPFSQSRFRFSRFMTGEETIARWATEGLPMDSQSIENAAIVQQTLLVPCFVDPQNQALPWLRRTLEGHHPAFVTMQHKRFMQILERQMLKGYPLVIEDVTFGCDPLLSVLLTMRPMKISSFSTTLSDSEDLNSPLSQGDVFFAQHSPSNTSPLLRKGPSIPDTVCHILGVSYPCDPKFRIYLFPSKAVIDFEPEVFSRVCIIDASVTLDGLEQQLLAKVIDIEKQELEEERIALLEVVRVGEEALRRLEDELLKKLSQSSGSLVDDDTLILTLQESKSSAERVKQQLAVASETNARIQEVRQEYRPVSLRGAILYFVSSEMSRIDSSYVLSLERMVTLFEAAIHSSLPSQVPSHRIANIVNTVTLQFFSYVGRGLFERHKILFSLSMAANIQIHAKQLQDFEFRLFLSGGSTIDLDEVLKTRPKQFPWLSSNAWKHCVALMDGAPAFRNLTEILGRNETLFRQWIESETPELDPIPYFSKPSPFERLLLVRCFREDRALNAAATYVKDILGPNFTEVPPYHLEPIIQTEAAPLRTPIMFLLTPGSDPTAYVEHVARKSKKNISQLSLGQGQEQLAVQLLLKSAQCGDWVIFQNCHLGVSFLQFLETWVLATTKPQEEPSETPPMVSLQPKRQFRQTTGTGSGVPKDGADGPEGKDHPEFRIFLTTEPTGAFPSKLALRCLRLTNEPPAGTRATMKKVLNWVQQDTWDLFPQPQWRACIQALCFYHCTLLERRKHGIYGWTTPYQFTEGDFNAAVFFLQNLFGALLSDDLRRNPISWEAVQFMIGEIHYGGRVTIRRDRHTLMAVTEQIFNANLTSTTKALLHPALQRFPVLSDVPDIPTWRTKVLDQFQADESPQFAGLYPNAEIAHRTKLTQATLATLLSIQPRRLQVATTQASTTTAKEAAPQASSPRTGGGSKKSVHSDASAQPASSGLHAEDIVLATCQRCLKLLPPIYSDVQLKEMVEARDRLKPLTIFFNLEAQRLRAVIVRVEGTLRQMVLAISGASALTPELSDVSAALSVGAVPTAFKSISWSSQSYPSWFNMLQRRHEQISEYFSKGERLVYDVACFFNAQGFLNSVRQQACRMRPPNSGWTLGRVETKLTVTKLNVSDVERAADEGGAFVTGFYLDGAGWDGQKGRLKAPLPKEVYRELPVVLVSAYLQATAPAPSARAPGQSGRRGTTADDRGAVKDETAEQELAAFGNITQAAFRAHRAQRSDVDGVVKKAKIPCFTSPLRGDENFLCDVELPHEEADPSVWALRGVAMLSTVE